METSDYEKQAKDFLKSTGVNFECEFLYNGKHFPDDKVTRDVYKITLTGHRHTYTFNFGQSIINSTGSDNVCSPTEYDVLACLTKYDPGTFEDFCSEFGYNPESKKDERVYNAVINEWENVSMLWDEEEIEMLSEIQ